jgi:hypothetical protein
MISLLLRARDANHVAVYTIHEPPNPQVGLVERAETLEFVRDGFSWQATLLPPLFFLGRQMWTEIAVYAAALTVSIVVMSLLHFSPELMFVLLAGAHVWLGFEAVDLHRDALMRHGWQMLGSVIGRNQLECERRFFDQWLASGGSPIPTMAAVPATLIGAIEQRLAAWTGRGTIKT